MNADEVKVAFPIVVRSKKSDKTLEVTKGVPLQVKKLIESDFNWDLYKTKELEVIGRSLFKLLEESSNTECEGITASAVACVLSLSIGSQYFYDRKYSVRRENTTLYDPVYPLVLDAYHAFFLDSIMNQVAKREAQLLEICKNDVTTNDTRGRFFELIVINRCLSYRRGTTLTWRGKKIPLPLGQLVDRFDANELPGGVELKKNGIYVPRSPNFPAIDFI